MKRRKPGTKGPDVSALRFVCMRIPTSGGGIDRAPSTVILHRVTDSSTDCLDNAWLYHEGVETSVATWACAPNL